MCVCAGGAPRGTVKREIRCTETSREHGSSGTSALPSLWVIVVQQRPRNPPLLFSSLSRSVRLPLPPPWHLCLQMRNGNFQCIMECWFPKERGRVSLIQIALHPLQVPNLVKSINYMCSGKRESTWAWSLGKNQLAHPVLHYRLIVLM